MTRALLRRTAAGLLAPAAVLAAAAAPAAAATHPAAVHPDACATTTVISIDKFAFSPAEVAPGQSATADLAATNCSGVPQDTEATWIAHWGGPSSGTLPAGCPVIDPLAEPLDFPAGGSLTTGVTYTVPAGCTATELDVTVRITGESTGTQLAEAVATLVIAQPVAGG